MIVYKEVIAKRPYVVTKICDKCKKRFTDVGEEIFEFQEFHHIRFTGGYDSVFGDGDAVSCDLCQHCLYELIKDFVRINYEDAIEEKG